MKIKTMTTMLVAIFCCTHTMGQVTSKTVENLVAGELTNVITSEDKLTITKLTITGAINSVDFNTMSHEMPILEEIDLEKTEIIRNAFLYAANTIPAKGVQIATLKKIILPIGTTEIEVSAFSGCTKLSEVVVPNKLITIKKGAFKDCTSLVSINFPNTLETIGNSAFLSCKSLTEITIPIAIKAIGLSAFFNCPKLTRIRVLNPKPISIDTSVFGGNTAQNQPGVDIENCNLIVPNESTSAYREAPVWGTFKLINERTNSAINTSTAENVKTWINNKKLFITSNKELYCIELFALNGQLLHKVKVGGYSYQMNINDEHISILKITHQDGTIQISKIAAN